MIDIKKPLYQQIYNYLIEAIKSGKYRNGDRLPSEKELADDFEVSRITSKKALEMLAEEGYISRIPGKGSFVGKEAEINKAFNLKSMQKTIGIVLPDFSESYGTRLLSGLEKAAADNGFYIIPRRTYGKQEIEEQEIQGLIELDVDGIILLPVHGENYNNKILKLILDGFPLVFVDRHMKGLAAPFVGTDNFCAAKKAVEYLFSLGHVNIGVLSPPYTNTSALEARVDGYVKAHAEHGIAVDESIWVDDLISTLPENNTSEIIQKDILKIKELLIKEPKITCLFSVEYNIALLAHEAVKMIGKKVPDDISILCFDGPTNYANQYFYTHVRQRETEMGETAVNLLIEQINNQAGEENKKVFLDADLIIGSTTKKMNQA